MRFETSRVREVGVYFNIRTYPNIFLTLLLGADLLGTGIEDILYFFRVKLWNILHGFQLEVLIYVYHLNNLQLTYQTK